MTHEEIQLLAYKLWEARTAKGLHISAEKDWIDAELISYLGVPIDVIDQVVDTVIFLEEQDRLVGQLDMPLDFTFT